MTSYDDEPLENLLRIQEDLRDANRGHVRAQKLLGRRMSEVSEAIRRKKTDEGDVIVTDHAVVRYLERIDGVDVEAVRQKIKHALSGRIDLALDHDVIADSASPAVFIVRKDGVVTSVLHADQGEIPIRGQLKRTSVLLEDKSKSGFIR